jgi:hypothetical protein
MKNEKLEMENLEGFHLSFNISHSLLEIIYNAFQCIFP